MAISIDCNIGVGGSFVSKKAKWPEFPPGPTDHIAAIGVLVVRFNELENTLQSLIAHYSTMDNEVTYFVIGRLPAPTQVDWLDKLLPIYEKNESVRGALELFTKAYRICNDNRGMVVHSTLWAYRASDDTIITSKRSRNHGKQNDQGFSLETLRRVADEILHWQRYGAVCMAYMRRREYKRKRLPKGLILFGPKGLPEAPAAPRKLSDCRPKPGTITQL